MNFITRISLFVELNGLPKQSAIRPAIQAENYLKCVLMFNFLKFVQLFER